MSMRGQCVADRTERIQMPQLVEKLKNDHAEIVAALEEIKGLGISHPDTLRKLTLAKAALLAHLKHEDAEFYPALIHAAVIDQKLQATLTVLQKDMENVAKVVLEFFAKYENGGPASEFAKDISLVRFTLATRIRREEERLYPLFDELKSKKSA
jgi:hypothetical protein